MRRRVPGNLLILVVMAFIIWMLMMISPTKFDMKPGFGGFISNTFRHLWETVTNWGNLAIILISLLMLFIINSIDKIIEGEKFNKLSPEQQEEYRENAKGSYISYLMRTGRDRQSEEEEEAMLIDHGFDGITELNNSLPQWWLAMFHGGWIIALVYILAYAFTDFAHQEVEYEVYNSKEEARVQKWIKENDITIDEAINKYTDQQALEAGKVTYELVCATCHTADGGGGIGPNLTDDYWVNHGETDLFKNIYDIIYNGSPKNAQMRPFGQEGELSGLAIQDVASYVYYLNQEAPQVTPAEGGAEPQGDKVDKWSRK